MSVDPFTFFAQIVNFAILAWLLKKVLYGPILQAIQARETAFMERTAELDQLEERTLRAQEALDLERSRFVEEREQKMADAQAEVDREKDRALKKVRLEVEALEAKWLASTREKQKSMMIELRDRTAKASCQMAVRVLQDMAKNASLQKVAFEQFLEDAKGTTIQGPAVLRSAHLLDETQQSQVREVLGDVSFEHDPSLVLGMEIIDNGTRYGFSAQAHLTALENELRQLVLDEVEA